MLKILKNIESDSLMPFILTTGVLLIMLSFIVPFPAILFIQDLLFFSYDHISFIRPSTAFFGFGLGMIWLALVLFSFLFTKIYCEKKEKNYSLTGLHLILFLFGFVIFFFSVFNYHYIDEQALHSNPILSISEKNIAWNDVEHVSREVRDDNAQVLSYTFSDNAIEITIPYDTEDTDTSSAIYSLMDKYDWDVKDHFVEGD